MGYFAKRDRHGHYKPWYSSGRKKNGCYVATSVYGSYDCPQVWTLRRFRDNTLAHNFFGVIFIKIYYAISPTAVKLFCKKQWFQNFWRKHLDKFVSELNESGVSDKPYSDPEY